MRGYQDTKDPRIKRRGEFYYAKFMKNKQMVNTSLGTKNFKVAQRLTDDIQNTILLGLNWRKDKELFEDAYQEFLTDKLKGTKTKKVRQSTLTQYAQFGENYFMPFWGSSLLSEINEESWDKYIDSVRKCKKDIKFFNHRKYLNAFLMWAQKRGKIKERPELYNPDPVTNSPGKVYTNSELKKLRDRAPMPFKVAVYMAQYMGMRSSEITQLKRVQIDLLKNHIVLYALDTKINKGRIVPIHDEARPLIEEQLESHDSPFLFPHKLRPKDEPMDPRGFKKRWNALREETEVEGRFHDFRHTYLTNVFKDPSIPHLLICDAAGLDIGVAQKTYVHFSVSDLQLITKKFRYEGK